MNIHVWSCMFHEFLFVGCFFVWVFLFGGGFVWLFWFGFVFNVFFNGLKNWTILNIFLKFEKGILLREDPKSRHLNELYSVLFRLSVATFMSRKKIKQSEFFLTLVTHLFVYSSRYQVSWSTCQPYFSKLFCIHDSKSPLPHFLLCFRKYLCYLQ